MQNPQIKQNFIVPFVCGITSISLCDYLTFFSVCQQKQKNKNKKKKAEEGERKKRERKTP